MKSHRKAYENIDEVSKRRLRPGGRVVVFPLFSLGETPFY